jgi:hypothetical protein
MFQINRVLMIVIISFFFTGHLYAQKTDPKTKGNVKAADKKSKDPLKEKKEVKKEEPVVQKEEPSSQSFFKKWNVNTSLSFTMASPMSASLSEIYGMGTGVSAVFSANVTPLISVAALQAFQSRLGLNLGFVSFPSKISGPDFTATTTHMPIILFYEPTREFSLSPAFAVRPFARIGGGMTRVTASTTRLDPATGENVSLSASSMDGTMLLALGSGFNFTKLPFMEFSLQASYYKVFESLSANFLYYSLGVHYKF